VTVPVYVADCLEPFDYSRLPSYVVAVAGYCGESINHIWTGAMINAVHAAGKRWWAIYTPLGATLTAADGQAAAVAMTKRLTSWSYPKLYPVFLDIERGVWDSNVNGAKACIAAWRAGMKKAGWTYAYPYAPRGSEPNWLPNWTGSAPATIPAGAVGVQYAGLVDGGRYDLSLFQQSLWDAGTSKLTEDPSIVDAATKAYFDSRFAAMHQDLIDLGDGMYWDRSRNGPLPAAMVHLKASLDAITAKVNTLSTGGVDSATVATQIAASLMATLAPDIVKALAAQLAK
jgi:hypothetical protein